MRFKKTPEFTAVIVFLRYAVDILSLSTRLDPRSTATNIITNAVNEPGAFDRRIVILDNDKNEQEMNQARTEAKQRGVEKIVWLKN